MGELSMQKSRFESIAPTRHEVTDVKTKDAAPSILVHVLSVPTCRVQIWFHSVLVCLKLHKYLMMMARQNIVFVPNFQHRP